MEHYEINRTTFGIFDVVDTTGKIVGSATTRAAAYSLVLARQKSEGYEDILRTEVRRAFVRATEDNGISERRAAEILRDEASRIFETTLNGAHVMRFIQNE